MRDPARIDPLIEQLRAAWKADPDLRLGQVIYNAARTDNPSTPGHKMGGRIFNIEDDILAKGLES